MDEVVPVAASATGGGPSEGAVCPAAEARELTAQPLSAAAPEFTWSWSRAFWAGIFTLPDPSLQVGGKLAAVPQSGGLDLGLSSLRMC